MICTTLYDIIVVNFIGKLVRLSKICSLQRYGWDIWIRVLLGVLNSCCQIELAYRLPLPYERDKSISRRPMERMFRCSRYAGGITKCLSNGLDTRYQLGWAGTFGDVIVLAYGQLPRTLVHILAFAADEEDRYIAVFA